MDTQTTLDPRLGTLAVLLTAKTAHSIQKASRNHFQWPESSFEQITRDRPRGVLA